MNFKRSLFLLITASSFVLSTTFGYTAQYPNSYPQTSQVTHLTSVTTTIFGEEAWKRGLKMEESEKPDYLMVYGYYQDAADEGNPNAMTRLGILYSLIGKPLV